MQPTLLSSGISKFGYKMPYLTYFGRPAKANEDRFKVLKESQKLVNPVGLKEYKYNVTNIIQTSSCKNDSITLSRLTLLETPPILKTESTLFSIWNFSTVKKLFNIFNENNLYQNIYNQCKETKGKFNNNTFSILGLLASSNRWSISDIAYLAAAQSNTKAGDFV